MRIMIKEETGNDVILTKRTVAFSESLAEVCLQIQTSDGMYNIKLPNEDVENVKQELLAKGYLDARNWEMDYLEYRE